jgi:peptide deformylase
MFRKGVTAPFSCSAVNSAHNFFNSQTFMAILEILQYPDPRLNQPAERVEKIDAATRQLIDDLAETMYAAPGVGLAATQVDVHKQIIVIDVSEDRSDLRVFINPEVIRREGVATNQEGCLSVPGIYDNVERAESVTVTALDRNGSRFTLNASGTLATCIQHEMDHLDGKVFVELLSELKQNRVRAKLKKRQRKAA